MTAVALRGLSKTYAGQNRPAVDDISLDIASGSLTALLGPSGCGKTTLLKMITGLLDPTGGDITFDGDSIVSLAPEKRNAVMVFQNHLLFPYMNVAANVGFGLKMRGVDKDTIARKVDETLALVHLAGFGARRPTELSGGQQQRVALARALIVQPRVLLLDEPLSNLDAHLRMEMRDFIRDLQRATKVTCLLVTHDQEEAVVLAGKIALILDGKLLQYASPQDLFERPASLEVAHFFGARNMLPGRHDGTAFHCAVGQLALAAPHGAGNYTAVLRPESMRLVTPDTPGSLACSVVDATYLGASCRMLVEVGDAPTRVTVTERTAIYRRHRQGEPLSLLINPQDAWLLDSAADVGK